MKTSKKYTPEEKLLIAVTLQAFNDFKYCLTEAKAYRKKLKTITNKHTKRIYKSKYKEAIMNYLSAKRYIEDFKLKEIYEKYQSYIF